MSDLKQNLRLADPVRAWNECRSWCIRIQKRNVVVFDSPELDAALIVRVCKNPAQAKRSATRAREWIHDGCPGGESFARLARAALGIPKQGGDALVSLEPSET